MSIGPRVVATHARRLFTIQALTLASTGVSATLASIVMLRLTGAAWAVSLPSAVMQLTGALAAVPAGRMMDRRGRRPGIALAMILGAVAFTLAAAGDGLGSLLLFGVGVVVAGVANGIAQLVRSAASDLYPPALRARGVGRVVAGGAVGAVVGPLLVPALAPLAGDVDRLTTVLPWMAAAVLYLVGLGLAVGLRPDPRDIGRLLAQGGDDAGTPGASGPSSTAEQASSGGVMPRSPAVLFRLAPVRAASLTHVVMQAVMALVMAAGSAVMSLHGHALGTISVIMTAHFLGMFAFAGPIGGLCDRIGRRPVLALGSLVTALGGVVFPLSLANSLIAGAAFTAVGLGWSLAFVAATAVLTDVAQPEERSALLGSNDLLTRMGAVVGSLASGTVFALGGPAVTGLIVLAASLAPLPWVLRLREPAPGRYAGVDGVPGHTPVQGRA
ncbi:MAG TPA: MFS transporter [Bacillota bacterium]